MPSIVVPFPLIECQVNWLLALWQNKIKLPPVEDRNKIASQVPGIGSPEIERHFHKMGSAQWSYNDLLAKEAGIDPIPRSIQALYEKVHFERREFGPGTGSEKLFSIAFILVLQDLEHPWNVFNGIFGGVFRIDPEVNSIHPQN